MHWSNIYCGGTTAQRESVVATLTERPSSDPSSSYSTYKAKHKYLLFWLDSSFPQMVYAILWSDFSTHESWPYAVESTHHKYIKG